jgi:hypothetical protein
MLAVCESVRKSPSGSTSGRFIPPDESRDFDPEFLIRVKLSDAIRKFSLNVPVVADSKANPKKIACGLT